MQGGHAIVVRLFERRFAGKQGLDNPDMTAPGRQNECSLAVPVSGIDIHLVLQQDLDDLYPAQRGGQYQWCLAAGVRELGIDTLCQQLLQRRDIAAPGGAG